MQYTAEYLKGYCACWQRVNEEIFVEFNSLPHPPIKEDFIEAFNQINKLMYEMLDKEEKKKEKLHLVKEDE